MTERRSLLSTVFGVAEAAPKRDYFSEIGVKSIINAAGAYSALGGARLRPQVVDAMRYAAVNKVKIAELHAAVGQRIAELAGCEAAMVTSGATASIVLGTAACMTMGDESRMLQLPDTGGMKNEIIVQKKHRYTYDRALRVAGAKLVDVETEVDVRRAVNERTAMMFFLKPAHSGDDIPRDSYIKLAQELKVPSFCDAATTTPPASNVVEQMRHGFDLVCYSGGKGLRGPYSAGLLLGRKDLVDAAKLNSSPHHESIGRGMKVAAEEYLGMLVAFEAGLNVSEEEDFAYKRGRFQNIINEIKDIAGVKTEVSISEGDVNELYLDIDWDQEVIDLDRQQFIQALRDSTPAVEVRLMLFSGGRIHLSATVMNDGEDVIVGKVIRQVLLAHSKS